MAGFIMDIDDILEENKDVLFRLKNFNTEQYISKEYLEYDKALNECLQMRSLKSEALKDGRTQYAKLSGDRFVSLKYVEGLSYRNCITPYIIFCACDSDFKFAYLKNIHDARGLFNKLVSALSEDKRPDLSELIEGFQ